MAKFKCDKCQADVPSSLRSKIGTSKIPTCVLCAEFINHQLQQLPPNQALLRIIAARKEQIRRIWYDLENG